MVLKQGWLWTGEHPFRRQFDGTVSVGEIGWKEGEIWCPAPLVCRFPVSRSGDYHIHGLRFRGGRWEPLEGTPIEGYLRYTFDRRPTEEVFAQLWTWTPWTDQVREVLSGSGLLIGPEVGLNAHVLRAVTHLSFAADASGTVPDGNTSCINYFRPPHSDGSMPDSPGFWSFASDPHDMADASVGTLGLVKSFDLNSAVEFVRMSKPLLALLQDLNSHGFLPFPKSARTCTQSSTIHPEVPLKKGVSGSLLAGAQNSVNKIFRRKTVDLRMCKRKNA
ncbi:hypothetical protein SISSUDRAFT_924644 [Sistotremastrum suecicum HHB10207 ss-3]|uniref:Uncharacterized protein n=1 Tax=Sistotremastrum suecicum HHB10207 ss-3 TaxID=1314776 RepID=A0A166BVB3_9AGAM|nr:hypothetical protein SISSUDRAFT_924644 [Sistotremastrum suecicum HHB10207 ss-3]